MKGRKERLCRGFILQNDPSELIQFVNSSKSFLRIHGLTESLKHHSHLSNIANVCVNIKINIILKNNIIEH